MTDPSLLRFKAVVAGALAHLESRREEINDLNVFPVADGDTGDNMALTLRACLDEVERLAASEERSLDEIGRAEIVESVSRAALLGARGNSGVILSQLIRGAASQLISTPGQLVDPVLMASAMSRAAARAYEAIRQPAEGTMLTVMRDMADAAMDFIAHSADRPVLTVEDPELQNRVLADALEHAIEAGERSLREGRDKLDALRDAGVVDAGGYGVLMIFAGVVAVLRGREAPELAHHDPPVVRRDDDGDHASSSYRFCTNFAVSGSPLDAAGATLALEAIGDSVLAVGDCHTLKVHVHTDDPNSAFAIFSPAAISHEDVADMWAQVSAREARLAQARCAAIAIVTGAGLRSLLQDTGALVLDGGPTLNPSTRDLLHAIEAAPGREAVLLPGSPNVFMAAEEAARLAGKPVRVVRTRTPQAAYLAALEFEPAQGADDNHERMDEGLAFIRSGGVAPAARDDADGRFAVGDAVGFVGDEVVAWGAPEDTLRKVLDVLADGAERVTALRGDGAPAAEVADLVPDEVEVEQHDGGQPAWWWLLAAE